MENHGAVIWVRNIKTKEVLDTENDGFCFQYHKQVQKLKVLLNLRMLQQEKVQSVMK